MVVVEVGVKRVLEMGNGTWPFELALCWCGWVYDYLPFVIFFGSLIPVFHGVGEDSGRGMFFIKCRLVFESCNIEVWNVYLL